ncbi:putative transmembrane anti-sigma factor [Denitrovibrio acetiphilus DSM 12809]|uniref:Putative transmembrane anti-sigma factor n=1 Tax=Denitrovibrio acetiphilus (strain DSM 12809 / NBRC 114555 / N2460) TaxID=522772 RepID=D4H1H5_DENA2|nr:anti-sigma factor [Denitrovibrio acetiphilus]ADD68735.1 putative transmembrane anti-sigma factor [Denitrovibrio acetiphilus DSM 12809]
MDCTKFRELISLYIDEESSAVQTQALEKHMETCGECRAALASQLKLRDMVCSSYVKTIDIDLSASIMGKINGAGEVKSKKPSSVKRLSMVVAAAAAVCVIAMAAMMSLNVDNNKVAGNEKLEEYVIEHVGSGVSDFQGEVEAVNIEK